MSAGRIPTTANSPLTTKGDLFTYSTSPARLAVGANGEQIVADSSTATGLRYTAGTVQANPVLNSAFQVWQRGTSIAQTAAIMYGADRWCSNRGGFDVGTTISRQATGDTTNLPNIQYAARVQRNSGTTATTAIYFSQSIETINSMPFMGKTVTFSFYARAGANFSSASNALSVSALTGTGTDQNVLSVWTGGSSLIGGTQTATLTTTWQRFTYTGTASSTGTEIGIYFNYTPVGTAGANDHFEITGVQLDIGSVALPFRTYAGTIQGETSACQRYYFRYGGTQIYEVNAWGVALNATTINYIIKHPTSMRVAPTSLDYSTLGTWQGGGIAAITALAIQSNQAGKDNTVVVATTTTAVTGGMYGLISNNSASAYVGLSAEL